MATVNRIKEAVAIYKQRREDIKKQVHEVANAVRQNRQTQKAELDRLR